MIGVIRAVSLATPPYLESLRVSVKGSGYVLSV